MNYERIYNDLTMKRKADPASLYGYAEKHHIIPSSIGGSDDESNKVSLTAREHFIAHCLLYEIYKNTEHRLKMYRAVSMMKRNKTGQRYFNSRIFEAIRIEAMSNYSISPESEYYRAEHFKITYYNRRYVDKNYVMPLEDRIDTETRYCKCGCGTEFLCKISSEKMYDLS